MKKQNSIKKDKKSVKVFGYVGVFASFLMAAFVVTYIWSPVVGINADDAPKTKIRAHIGSYNGLAIGDNYSSEVNFTFSEYDMPSDSDDPGYVTTKNSSLYVYATTNDADGYEVYISSPDEDSALVNTASGDRIEGFAEEISGYINTDEITKNWGLRNPSTNNYIALPKASAPVIIASGKGPVTEKRTNIQFTLVANPVQLSAGYYEKPIVFTLVTRDIPENYTGMDELGNCTDTRTIYDINTMQQMNKCICANTNTPAVNSSFTWSYNSSQNYTPSAVLTDIRDGSEYVVSKYADGNCWMGQNLDLNLPAGTVLSKNTTDLNSVDTLEFNDSGSFAPDSSRAFFRGGNAPSSSPTSSSDSYRYQRTGKFYTWSNALAKNTEEPGVDSICPKGWTLPTNDENAMIKTKYGAYYSGYSGVFARTPVNYIFGGYFEEGVHVNYSAGSSSSTVGTGYIWSSTSDDSDNAFASFINKNTLNGVASGYYPSQSTLKSWGLSVRCVARK